MHGHSFRFAAHVANSSTWDAGSEKIIACRTLMKLIYPHQKSRQLEPIQLCWLLITLGIACNPRFPGDFVYC